MHDTEATTSTSRRDNSEFIVESRSRSISSFTLLSFSMNVSVRGM
jgi:hypothetical protein